MGLIPGEGKDNEAPPNMTGHAWFLRSCVGLAFALWSAAMAQPLADFTGHNPGMSDWGIVQTNQVYPLVTGKAPWPCAVFVAGNFVAIVLAAVMVGALASHDEGLRDTANGLSGLLGLWLGVCGFFSLIFVFGGSGSKPLPAGATPDHFTPLAGTWLIWLAMALLILPAQHSYTLPAPATTDS